MFSFYRALAVLIYLVGTADMALVQGNGVARILGACFGAQSCMGLRWHYEANSSPIFNTVEDSEKWNCSVIDVLGTKEAANNVQLGFYMRSIVSHNSCVPHGKLFSQNRPYDAIPISFNYPVVYSSLDYSDFVVETSTGEKVTPDCAMLTPADESNEGLTVALAGYFGGRTAGTWPKSVSVISNLLLVDLSGSKTNPKTYDAKGLTLAITDGVRPWPNIIDRDSLNTETVGHVTELPAYGQGLEFTSELVMLQAVFYKFSTEGEGKKPSFPGKNHCRMDFNKTTHVIKVMGNGGFTTNGINELFPDDTAVLDVVLANGSSIDSHKYLGLADLGFDDSWTTATGRAGYKGDRDNFIDICLELTEEEAAAQGGGEISYVYLKAGAVMPPTGTTNARLNQGMYVAISHYPHYPYDVPYTTFMDQMTTFKAEIKCAVGVVVMVVTLIIYFLCWK